MNDQLNLFPTKWRVTLLITSLILAGSLLAAAQTENVLYRFQGGNDGSEPQGGLVSDAAGNFYGTTELGGTGCSCGTVFEVTPTVSGKWTESVLYSFQGGSDGSKPSSGLTFDQAGNLYGTTWAGGSANAGTVFKLTPGGGTWTETVIYSFQGGVDGAHTVAGLVFDAAGNLYGTTGLGGLYNNGTAFQLTPQGTGWTESVIHSFGHGKDGAGPNSLIIGKTGNLFGTTGSGGGSFGNSYGTVFVLVPPATHGGSWTEEVIHRFTSTDGAGPYAALIFDQKGNLDGTTSIGGTDNAGTVFQLTRGLSGGWTETVLYSFTGGNDGGAPTGSLIFDHAGNLYGTTLHGGTGGFCFTTTTCGTVFELTPPVAEGDPWTESVLHNFTLSDRDGFWPTSGLTRGKFGALYSTTEAGGTKKGVGTVFRIHP